MFAESRPIDAPAEAALAPFRCCAAAVAASQENALAVSQAAGDMMSSVLALWSRQALVGMRWALAPVSENQVRRMR